MDEWVWIVLIAASVFFLPLILAIVALNKAERVARELFKLRNELNLLKAQAIQPPEPAAAAPALEQQAEPAPEAETVSAAAPEPEAIAAPEPPREAARASRILPGAGSSGSALSPSRWPGCSWSSTWPTTACLVRECGSCWDWRPALR
jgi:uncharacterized membrane protein